eukprot:TRINITY_DN10595_c0_g1_i6.p1 TRINITY_DN10595_c0_g1~~TRINITY_DN10595_c0_g1_i6.p1  ORF type:complete len:925 (-),score=177.58 TRINITY_DN10595_c0_g1_i6:1495-4269(-)
MYSQLVSARHALSLAVVRYDKIGRGSANGFLQWALRSNTSFWVWSSLMLLEGYAAAALWIWEDYKGQTDYTWGLDMAVAFLSMLNILYRVGSSKWLHALLSLETIVDLLTIVPMIVSIVDYVDDGKDIDYVQFHFLRVLYLLFIWDRFHFFWPFSLLSEFKFQLIKTLYLIACLPFCCAGFFQLVAREQQEDFPYEPPLRFWNSLYWAFVTLSTVGYGDISPRASNYGQLIAIGSIVVALTVVPAQISSLASILASSSKFGGKSQSRGHILVCSEKPIDFAQLTDLLLEFYHEDNQRQDVEMVILCAAEPDENLQKLLQAETFFRTRITYLVGNCTIPHDLRRAGITTASGILLLKSDIDAIQILQTLTIRKVRSDVPIYINLNGMDDMESLPNDPALHVVHSLDRLHHMILGYSCVAPGYSTWLLNMFNTASDEYRPLTWQQHYMYGVGFEPHHLSMPRHFAGKTFTQAALELYTEFEVMLLAYVHHKNNKHFVLVNPSDFRFEGGEVTYAIAQDQDQLDEIEKHYQQLALRVEPDLSEKSRLLGSPAPACITDVMSMAAAAAGVQSVSPSLQIVPEEQADLRFLHELGVDTSSYDKLSSISHSYALGVFESTARSQSKVQEKMAEIRRVETANISGHVIICTEHDTQLPDILRPLRHPQLGDSCMPVVVLCPNEVASLESDLFSHRFHEVYYVQGSATKSVDLDRANISQAKAVVLLSDASDKSFCSDAATVMATHCVFNVVKERHSPAQLVLVDLAFWNNVQFFSNSLKEAEALWIETAVYAAGRTFSGEKFHTMILKPLIDKHLFELFLSLIPGARSMPKEARFVVHDLPSEILGAVQKGETRMYLDLVASVCRRGCVPVGLYRKEGTEDNSLPYVYTNPPKDCVLAASDKVFVFTATVPAVLAAEKGKGFELEPTDLLQ